MQAHAHAKKCKYGNGSTVRISEKPCKRANLSFRAGTGILSGTKIKFLKKILGAALLSSANWLYSTMYSSSTVKLERDSVTVRCCHSTCQHLHTISFRNNVIKYCKRWIALFTFCHNSAFCCMISVFDAWKYFLPSSYYYPVIFCHSFTLYVLDVEYTPHENTFLHCISPKAKPHVGEIEKW